MNKNIRKIFLIFGVLTMCLCFTACDKKQENNNADDYTFFEEAGKIRYAERYQIVSLTESGILYEGEDDLMHLVTIDDREDIILCYEPNCEHRAATAANRDPKCMAALFYEKTDTAYYEGYIYFFVNDSVFSHKLYRMKTNGAGRELIGELPFSYKINYGVIFSEDKMYYTAKMPHEDEITNTVQYTNRLVEYNLLNNTYRLITTETEDAITLMHLAGNTMFLRMSDNSNGGKLYLMKVNLETMEEKVIIPSEIYSEKYSYIRAYDEDSYFYYDRQTYEIGIKSTDGVSQEILLKGAEGEDYCWATPSRNGLFYGRMYDYGDETAGYYYMDLLTGEVTNITEETEKYDIIAYDGYYDIFITRDLDFNWGMLSREKVLGEAEIN